MRITSDIKNIRVASTAVIDYIKEVKKDVDKDTLFDIKLCVEEAVRNAIVHGNKSNQGLPVDISFTIQDNTLKITVEDKGKGFDVKSLSNPTFSENLYKESGRGVYIMRRVMDKVCYNEKGNCVTMEKRLEENHADKDRG